MLNNFLDDSFEPKNEDVKPTPRLNAILGKTPISIYFILINVIIYLLVIIIEGGEEYNWKFGSLDFSIVTLHNEYYRFITAFFLHGSFIHIFLNMFSLLMVGPLIEMIFARVNFFILYMLTGIISTTSSYFFTLSSLGDSIENSGPIETVGASGAVFGIVGGFTLFIIKNKGVIKHNIRKRLLINLLTVISLNLAFGLFSGLPIDNAGHIGGLLSGVFIAFFLKPQILGTKKQPIASIIAVLLIALFLISLAWASYNYITSTRHSKSMLEHYFP